MKTVVAKWDKHEPCEHKQTDCDHYIHRCVSVIMCVCARMLCVRERARRVCVSVARMWLSAVFVCEREKASAAPIHYPVNTAWARAII